MGEAFEQQPREGAKAFAAFSVYLSLGAERSIRAVGEKLGKSEGLLERWSGKFDWPARVQAQAAYLATVEREATEALTRTKAAQWLTRREEHKEDEWGLRAELIAASREALKPFRERGKQATLGDIARAVDLASKLGRLATGLATDHTEVTGEGDGPIQVDLEMALRKIYREPLAADVLDVEVKLLGEEKNMAAVGASTN